MKTSKLLAIAGFLAAFAVAAHAQQQGAQQQGDKERFRFRTGIELINISATVTDGSGRFVSGLRKEDFRIYQDDQPQQISHFSSDRVPVSLGIILDTSGSMEGEKMIAAKQALNRFLLELLGPDDEVFLYRFDSQPELVHGWTSDRRRVSRELDMIRARGGTALYDAVAEAIPLAQSGKHRKKAIVIISDGNDQNSSTPIEALQAQIRETEILIYAIGIDSQMSDSYGPVRRTRAPSWSDAIDILMQGKPRPLPFPVPGGKKNSPPPRPGPSSSPPPPNPGPRIPGMPPSTPPVIVPRNGSRSSGSNSDSVNVAALRDITDNSGGRTEVIRSARDLEPATAYIADELSKQYFIGYPAAGQKDGRWHSIRVEVRNPTYTVRARKGFVATP